MLHILLGVKRNVINDLYMTFGMQLFGKRVRMQSSLQLTSVITQIRLIGCMNDDKWNAGSS